MADRDADCGQKCHWGNLRELGVFLRAELLTDKNRLLVFVMVVRIKASEEGIVVCRKVSEDELMVKQMGQ